MTIHIEAILFDMGGTLRRTTKREPVEKFEMIKQILNLTGLIADPEEFARLLKIRATAYHKWAKKNLAELNESDLWTRWMLPDFPADKISPIAVQLNQIWRDVHGRRNAIPEVPETVLSLYRRGYRLGLVSNTTSSVEVPRTLSELGIAGCFDTVVLSCEVGKRKPGAAILLEATGRMGAEPRRCAYIGDRPNRDVISSRRAGFGQTIILRDPQKPVHPSSNPLLMPDRFIDNLRELLDIFPPLHNPKIPGSNRPVYDISLSTMWGIKQFSAFSDFFLTASRLGFERVELNHQVSPSMLAGINLDGCVVSSIHEPCPAVIPARKMREQDLLISSTDEECRREGVNSIKRSIDLAKELHSKVIVVHAGQVQADWSFERKLHSLFNESLAGSPEYQELRDRLVKQRAALVGPHLYAVKKSLRELVEHAGRINIRLGIENRYHFYDIPSVDEMGEILELADPNLLGFIYDVGHAQTQDQLGFYPHESWLKSYASRMVGVHLHDVIGIHDHLAPGLGQVDFRMVASYLPQGAIRTLEVMNFNTPEQIRRGLKLLVDTGCVNLI
jgi:FMN phosphatase YigB (HAD superfamily)/sugar phosphate isomerase/epimerase